VSVINILIGVAIGSVATYLIANPEKRAALFARIATIVTSAKKS
jgi:hypothetical protein